MRQRFEALSQRMTYGTLATLPPFAPIPSDTVPEEAQRQMHRFLRGVAEKLAQNPGIIGLPDIPDGAFEDWELFKGRPELIDAMRRLLRKLEEFYDLLYQLGSAAVIEDGRLSVDKADMKVPPKTLQALGALGLYYENQKERLLLWSGEYPELAYGWKLLSAVAKEKENSGILFSRAIFSPSNARAVDVFRALAPNRQAFDILEGYFNGSGYRLAELREGVSVDWVKTYTKKDEPLKAHWAERVHGGLSIVYDSRRANPVIYGLRLPMFKELLARFSEMGDGVKDLVVARTKKCDGCGYCTQTDKTGKRPRQIVTVRQGQQEYDLCTLFPGFSYVWTKLDEAEAKRIIGLLEFVDQVCSQ